MSEAAELIDQVADTLVWMHDIGSIFAETCCAANGEMTVTEASIAEILRSPLQRDAKGWSPQRWIVSGREVQEIGARELDEISLIAAEVKNERARSLIYDFLWHVRHSERPHEHAKCALSAHLAIIGDDELKPVDRLRSCERATDLTLSLGLATQPAATALKGLIKDFISTSDVDWATSALQVRTELTREDFPFELIEHIEDLATDPHVLERLAGVKHRLNPEQTPANFDRTITAFRDLAACSTSFQRSVWLREALRVATERGHPSAADLRSELQTTDPFEGVEPLRTDVTINHAEIDRFMQWAVDDDNLVSALTRIGNQFAHEVNEVLNSEPEPGTADLLQIPGRLIGPHGSVLRDQVADLGSHMATKMAVNMALEALFLPSLDLAIRSYGIDNDDVAPLFAHPLISAPAKQGLVEAIVLFGERRYEPSACSALPCVERILRAVGVAQGAVVTNQPAGHRRGGVKTLGEILNGLKTGDRPLLSPDLIELLEFVLTDDLEGLNLRNEILHGLLTDSTQGYQATAVLLAAITLVIGLPTQSGDGWAPVKT